VALTQARLQNRQLKQDVFDKRFKVYIGVQYYVVSLLRDDDEQSDRFASYRQFRSETDPGEFLFKKEVWVYIESIGNIGTRFRTAQSQVKAHSVTVQPSIHPINNQDWLTEAATRLDQAQQEEEKLRQLITQAFETGIKSAFAKDLQLQA
jgi:hypothetical protein